MSSLFDVPAQLVLILTLAASGGTSATGLRAVAPEASVGSSAEDTEARSIPFEEQKWLEALRSGAAGEPLAAEAGRIFRTSSGRYYVPVGSERRRILDLRKDADISALVAFELARQNAERLQQALRRAPSAGDLYLAHILGAERSIALLTSAPSDQERPVADVLPGVLDDWPELRQAGGRPASVASVVARLKRAIERRPTGAEVAQWFVRARRSLGGDLDTRGEDGRAVGTPAAESSWQTVVMVAQ